MQKRFFAALALTLVTAGAAYAQSNARMLADIPFAFRAGNNVLPAGHYVIRPAIAPGVLLLHCAERNASAMIVTNNLNSREVPEKSLLVFNRYGNSHFLSKVVTAGYTAGNELKKSKAELETASNGVPDRVTVAVRQR